MSEVGDGPGVNPQKASANACRKAIIDLTSEMP
jgi:hypothetical protein